MVWLGIVPWNNLSRFTKDNQLPKLIPLASLILFSCSRENWECSNILLTLAGHGNISFSFEKCGHVQVFLAAEQSQVSSSILGKKRESVSCGMQNNQGSPSPRCVLWGRCENSLFLGYFGSRSASCSWCPPFYLLSIPSSLSGPEIRRLTNTCDCWKLCMPENVSVFHTFDKKTTSKTWNTPTCSILTSIFKYSRQNVPLFRGREQPKIQAKRSTKYSLFGHIQKTEAWEFT